MTGDHGATIAKRLNGGVRLPASFIAAESGGVLTKREAQFVPAALRLNDMAPGGYVAAALARTAGAGDTCGLQPALGLDEAR